MSQYVVNEPRRHREGWNHNPTERHRAFCDGVQDRDPDAGWNTTRRPVTGHARVLRLPADHAARHPRLGTHRTDVGKAA